ncbi:MAG: glycosyltransferase family 2 protein [Candidatus Electrothrix sp. AX1]|nr:glycosyltransferase family 2 protein [Candidatus Electrothrix sp. AX1]
MMNPFLSCIYVIDELPFLKYWPWKESLGSVLKFADEVIVVHGGKTDSKGRSPSLDYLRSLQNSRLRIETFTWREDFDWRQIARTCTFGHILARGQWCFRALADEFFPSDFLKIQKYLEQQPEHIKIASVDRLYMLGNKYACPFHDKPLFFRNDLSIGYGTVNPAQGEAASYLLFDDPIETDFWFNGSAVVSNAETSILRDTQGVERLHQGETPRGYRGETTSHMTATLPLGVLNTDVNYFPDDVLLDQKELSQLGYQRLPPEYPQRRVLSPDETRKALEQKICGMIQRGKLLHVDLPESLHEFIDKQNETTNCIRRLCEETHGLPWNRLSKKTLSIKYIRTLASNRLRNSIRI